VKTEVPSPSTPPAKLRALADVKLNAPRQRLFEVAAGVCGGPPPWRRRKLAEARDLLALAQISGRLTVEWLDLLDDLRALVRLAAAVPLLPRPEGPLAIAREAVLGLTYRASALVAPAHGPSFVQILAPHGVWHANVSVSHGQVLCLGPLLPAGVPLREIVLMAYGALTMQTVQFDALDPAGVLNPLAADWWQRNPALVPLSREPFLKPPEARP
jgi:hypothetical protein